MVSGVGTHVLQLSKELVNKGHEVQVFSSNLSKERSKTTVSSYDLVEGIEARRFKVFKIPRVFSGYVPSPSFVKALLGSDADIIHAHSYVYFPTYVSAFSKAIKKTVLVLTTHQPPTQSAFQNQLLMNMYNNSIGKFALGIADGIIAITELEKTFLAKVAGVQLKKIKVIPEGVDLKQFHPKGVKSKKKKEILYVGRLSSEKGLLYLIDAVPKVISKYPSAKFVFVGEDCGIKQAITERAQEHEVEQNIEFLEPKFGADLAGVYRNANLFVLPSLYETFGLVILEAMASGLPVIATKVGGVPTLIKDGYNGYLVSPGDSNALAEEIIRLLSSHSLYKRMSKHNIETAKHYSWKRIVNSIENFYKSLIDMTS